MCVGRRHLEFCDRAGRWRCAGTRLLLLVVFAAAGDARTRFSARSAGSSQALRPVRTVGMSTPAWYDDLPQAMSEAEYKALPEEVARTIEVVHGDVIRCESPSDGRIWPGVG